MYNIHIKNRSCIESLHVSIVQLTRSPPATNSVTAASSWSVSKAESMRTTLGWERRDSWGVSKKGATSRASPKKRI